MNTKPIELARKSLDELIVLQKEVTMEPGALDYYRALATGCELLSQVAIAEALTDISETLRKLCERNGDGNLYLRVTRRGS